MHPVLFRVVVPLAVIALVAGAVRATPSIASTLLDSEPGERSARGFGGADLPAPPPSLARHVGSFTRNTLTVKVSGSRGGIQTGPFTGLAFGEAQRGKTLTVRLDEVTSAGGEALPGVPIYLYRSLAGPVRPGGEIAAFSVPPVRQAEAVVVDRSGGVLVWRTEPGTFFVFFAYTRPIVQVPPGLRPGTVAYTITVE